MNLIKELIEKKKKYCDCGKEIFSNSIRCQKCNSLHQRKVKNRPDNEELKKLVSQTSLESAGRKYNVSGNTIKKWLKNKIE